MNSSERWEGARGDVSKGSIFSAVVFWEERALICISVQAALTTERGGKFQFGMDMKLRWVIFFSCNGTTRRTRRFDVVGREKKISKWNMILFPSLGTILNKQAGVFSGSKKVAKKVDS